MDTTKEVFQGQLTRNLKAFLKARGEEFNLEKTPEYLTHGVNMLKRVYGVKLAAYMCRLNETKRFSKWAKGEDLPQAYEAGALLEAIEITEILLGRLSEYEARDWMKSPCEYLFYNLPMDFIRDVPDEVRRAALRLHV